MTKNVDAEEYSLAFSPAMKGVFFQVKKMSLTENITKGL